MLACATTGSEQSDVAVPADTKSCVMLVEVRVNGSRPLWFILDSGSTQMLIDIAVARDLDLNLETSATLQGVGGTANAARVVDPLSVVLKDHAVNGLKFYAVDLTDASRSLGRHVDGILGCEFFERFTVVMAFARSEVFLRPRY